MEETNKIGNTLWVLLLLLGALVVFSAIPFGFYDSMGLTGIDMLADLRKEEDVKRIAQSKPKTHKTKPKIGEPIKVEIPCPQGTTCIEDYSEDGKTMNALLESLFQSRYKKGTTRIAFYGDSFIEGDIFCGDLRDTLQDLFGGRGVGFAPVKSEASSFRNTLKSEARGWKSYSVIDKENFKGFGISGLNFKPVQPDAQVSFTPQANSPFKELYVYYASKEPTAVKLVSNRKKELYDTLDIAPGLGIQKIYTRDSVLKNLKVSFPLQDSLYVYGFSFESGPGLYIDNFSMRSNSGMSLERIQAPMLNRFQKELKYKLIVLQFGLNVAGPKDKKFDWYVRAMVRLINTMKAQFPEASFLLLGTSDRATKINGVYKTMPSISYLIEAQRQIAQETQIAFWDMFGAMGGENSMVSYVKARPRLANEDYTHLTFEGGKKIAIEFTKSLMHEYGKYEKAKKTPAPAPVAQ